MYRLATRDPGQSGRPQRREYGAPAVDDAAISGGVGKPGPTMGQTGDVDSAYWPLGSVSPETAAPTLTSRFSRSAELHVKAPGNPLGH